jgi:hypothetical protein
MIKHLTQEPIRINSVPVAMVAFMPNLFRTAIEIKFPGTYNI